MDSETHLSQQLTKLFASKMNLAVASPELDLIAAGLLDSLAFVDLLVQLEHEFDVQIDLDHLEVDNFRSIASIAAFIARQRGESAPGHLRLVNRPLRARAAIPTSGMIMGSFHVPALRRLVMSSSRIKLREWSISLRWGVMI